MTGAAWLIVGVALALIGVVVAFVLLRIFDRRP
jgi:hypothetical protein